MRRKRLIVFTGIDGSGKTTQAKLLFEKLIKDNVKVDFIRSKWEPFIIKPLIRKWKSRGVTNVPSSVNDDIDGKNKKQKLLSNPFVRNMWLFAFFVDYGLQLFLKIRLRLLSKGLILSDRIFYDSIIDQAVNLGERKEQLLSKLDSLWMKILFPMPDMVFYIDCPEDIAFSRKNDEYTTNIEYLIDRRKIFLELADRYNWVKIDGSSPIEKIAVDIKDKFYNDLALQAKKL